MFGMIFFGHGVLSSEMWKEVSVFLTWKI